MVNFAEFYMPVARSPALQAMVLLWELLTPGWGFLFRWWVPLGRAE